MKVMIDFKGKRLLLLAYVPPWSVVTPDGYTHRILAMAVRLEQMGFNVSILWLYSIHLYFRIKSSWLSSSTVKSIFRPVLPFYQYRLMSKLSRWFSKLWLKRLDKKFNYDLFQAETALTGSLCSAIQGKKIIVDFHGDLIAEMDMRNDSRWKISLAFQEEQDALKVASGILTASNKLIELLRERHGMFNTKAASVPCGVDVTRFSHAASNRNSQRKQLKLEDRIVFCYLGGLQKWQNIDETIVLFKRIHSLDNRAYLLLITNGDTSECQKKLKDIGNYGENYAFMSLLSDQIPTYLPMADFGFLLRADSPVNRVASPTKLGEYLAAGMPVITTPFAGDATQIVEERGCGFILVDAEYSTFTKLLSYIEKSMKERERLFAFCRETALSSQSWHSSEDCMVVLYRDVLTK
jgi:glycosyltransferase involved in cell wall biosynthesis